MHRRQLIKAMGVMLGGVVTGSISRTLSAAGQARRHASIPYFSTYQKEQIATLAELIIPTTDTPGAIAAGVPGFVEMMVAEWYTPREREIFIKGLRELDKWCQTNTDKLFNQSSGEQQTAALQAAEQSAGAYQPPQASVSIFPDKTVDEGAPFFTKLRELVVVGYYTSEVGARAEHKFFIMTPDFDGDYDLAKTGGRQWSYVGR
jgi:hypothetical protein